LLNIESKAKEKVVKIQKIEGLEARLLVIHENLNLAHVEKERMEQILIVLNKNPADSPEFTNNLVNTMKTIRKLVEFEAKETKSIKD